LVKAKLANQTLMVYSIFQRFNADEIIAHIKERHAGKVVWVYLDMPSCTALDLKDGPRMRIVNNSDLIRFLEEADFRLRTGTIRNHQRPR